MENTSTQTHDYRRELETDLRQIKMNTNLKFLCLKGQKKKKRGEY